MQTIDTKVFALIALATLVVVELLKAFFPAKLEGKEAKLAMLLPILFTVGAKALGWFQGTEWVDALMWAFGGGATSGVAHDKLLNPIKGMVEGILPKKPPTQ